MEALKFMPEPKIDNFLSPELDTQEFRDAIQRLDKSGKFLEFIAHMDTPEFIEPWQDYLQYRIEQGFAKKRKPYQPVGFKMTLMRLARIGPQRAAEAIEHSVHMSYQGIFEASSL